MYSNSSRLEEASKARFINTVWDELEDDPATVMYMVGEDVSKFPSRETITKWVDSGAADKFLKSSNFNWQKFAAGEIQNDIPLYVELIIAYLDYVKAGGSNKEKKQILKQDPVLVFENNNEGLKVVHEGSDLTGADIVILDSFENKQWLFAIPLTHKACTFMNSFECGGQGSKWCIGQKNDPSYWKQYTRSNSWFVLAFNKDPFCEENHKKYMLEFIVDVDALNIQTKSVNNPRDVNLNIWCQEDTNDTKDFNVYPTKYKSYVQERFDFSVVDFLEYFIENIIQNNNRYSDCIPVSSKVVWKINAGELTAQDLKNYPSRTNIIINPRTVPVHSVQELQNVIMNILHCLEESQRQDILFTVNKYRFDKQTDGDFYLDVRDLNLMDLYWNCGFIIQFTHCYFNNVFIEIPDEKDYVNFDKKNGSNSFTKIVINGKNCTKDYLRNTDYYPLSIKDFLIVMLEEDNKSEIKDMIRNHQEEIEKFLCDYFKVASDEEINSDLLYRIFNSKVKKQFRESISKKQNRKGMLWDFDSELNEKETVRIQFADDNEAEEFKSEMKNRFHYPKVKSRYEVVSGTGKTGKAVYVENKLKEEVYIAEPEQPMQMYIVKDDYPDVYYAYIVSKKKRYGVLLNAMISKYGYKIVFSRPEFCSYAKAIPVREANNDIYIEHCVDKHNMKLLDALKEFLKTAKITDLKRLSDCIIEIPKETGFLNKQLKSRKFQESEIRMLSQKDICLDLTGVIQDILENFDNSASNIHLLESVKVDYWGTKVAWISGGLNGLGNWSDYLNDLADFMVELEDTLQTTYTKNARVYVIDIISDNLDDVFNVLIGISVGESFDETESSEWHEKHYAEDINDIDFEWDEDVTDWLFYKQEHLKLL